MERGLLSICVPIYRGEQFLAEALNCIRSQTYKRFEVILSIDGHDPACENICLPFLADPRFKLFRQPKRLGWVENLNWTFRKASGEFAYFHQQDDLADKRYAATLIKHLQRHPEAALAYCDLQPKGRIEGSFRQVPPVTGATARTRVLTMLSDHFGAFAFRGVFRRELLPKVGPIPTNEVDDFGVDICWLTGIAAHGELHHLPVKFYWKRYHEKNTESRWWEWPLERKFSAWAHHCVGMLKQGLRGSRNPAEGRLIWNACIFQARPRSNVAISHCAFSSRQCILCNRCP